jgi:cytochrome b561
MNQVSRYHPVLVTLHWLLAFLIVVALILGYFGLAAMPNSDPQKIDALRGHMIAGMSILVLMAVRLAVRMWTSKPAAATTGYPLLDRVARVTHYGFYILVLAMAGTGLATALLVGLPGIVLGGSGAPLPADFMSYPTRIAHGYVALLLVGLIVLHVSAALYHQLVRRDRLLRRMSYGRGQP